MLEYIEKEGVINFFYLHIIHLSNIYLYAKNGYDASLCKRMYALHNENVL